MTKVNTKHSFDAIAVANVAIMLAQNKGEKISNLLLQKLLYFMQGHTLHSFEVPLFYNDIEAWEHGPVVPDVYFAIKNHDLEDKDWSLKGVINDSTIDIPRVRNMIGLVYDRYSVYDPWDLVAITHEKGTPWHKIRKNGGGKIPLELIKSEFDKRIAE